MTIAPYLAAVVQRPTFMSATESRTRAFMEQNRDDVVNWIRMACDRDPVRLFVFPVLTLTGSTPRPQPFNGTSAELEVTDPIFDPIIAACAQYDCYVAFTIVERHPLLPGRRLHTAVLFGPDGLVLRQPKKHARNAPGASNLNMFREEYEAILGPVHAVADTPLGKIGMVVMGELFVPENVRALAKHGAEIILQPTIEPDYLVAPSLAIKRAAAYQNGVYVLSAAVEFERMAMPDGSNTNQLCSGGSAIIAPDGELLHGLGDLEAVATATIDHARLHEIREANSRDLFVDWGFFSDIYR